MKILTFLAGWSSLLCSFIRETRRLHGRIRGMRKQLTQIVQLQSTSSTGKLRKITRDYQKDKSVI